jgi:hypothetical protein
LREPDHAANIAAAKVKEGFTAIKVKLGPDAEKDLARVRAVREAIGPATKLNIDVNGGWSLEHPSGMRCKTWCPVPVGTPYVDRTTGTRYDCRFHRTFRSPAELLGVVFSESGMATAAPFRT